MYNAYQGYSENIYPYNWTSMPFFTLNLGDNDQGVHIHPTDVIDQDDKYLMRIDLAGYHKDDVKVKVSGDIIGIVASANHDISREYKVISREIPFGEFKREYQLNNINMESITARFQDGILNIELPKVSEKSIDNNEGKNLKDNDTQDKTAKSDGTKCESQSPVIRKSPSVGIDK